MIVFRILFFVIQAILSFLIGLIILVFGTVYCLGVSVVILGGYAVDYGCSMFKDILLKYFHNPSPISYILQPGDFDISKCVVLRYSVRKDDCYRWFVVAGCPSTELYLEFSKQYAYAKWVSYACKGNANVIGELCGGRIHDTEEALQWLHNRHRELHECTVFTVEYQDDGSIDLHPKHCYFQHGVA